MIHPLLEYCQKIVILCCISTLELMKITSAVFKSSSQKMAQIPSDKPEFAFIGRSNVGKSSLINMLTGQPGMAKVSNTPGKTRLINHFLINSSWYLVDLPGYGYARVAKKLHREFSDIIETYITESKQLVFLFVLVDSRLEPQKNDMAFIHLLGLEQIPFGLVFTKADKLSKEQVASHVARYKKALLEEWEELPPIFITSSQKKQGRDEMLDFIGESLKNIDQ